MNIERRIKERKGSGGQATPLKPVSEKSDKPGPTEPVSNQFGDTLNRKDWKGSSGRKSWK